jgi:hypothetical protein
MANNKVQLADGSVLIDLTDTTAVVADVAQGKYFYGADGVKREGIASSSGGEDFLVKRCQNTLTSYESEDVTKIIAAAFRDCSALTSLKTYNVKTFGGYVFYQTHLQKIAFPKATDIAVQTFCNIASGYLKELDFGTSLSRIRQQAFSNNSNFEVLVLRRNGVTTLDNINSFNSTNFASGKAGGTLYVPQAQIANYQSATNWSTILGYTNNQILPIEGSIYETQYADGTPIA